MALSGVVKVACVAGAERGGKRGEIIRERGGSGRKGEEGSHAGLPTPYYNYVECKLRNKSFEYLVVAKHSFLVPICYSSLFSSHWQVGGQNWHDAKSAKKDYILICFIGLSTVAMAT